MPDPSTDFSPDVGQPAWKVALFYPEQGGWTEADYFELEGGPLVEYDQGCIEVLDLPSKEHQRMAQFLFLLLVTYVRERKQGEVFVAPLPIRLWPGKYREPDVVFLEKSRRETGGVSDGADLVIEVLGPGAESRRRDLVTKVDDYAKAGIAEYWIVDPEEKLITVLSLDDDSYSQHGLFAEGQTATSKLLPSFTVPVTQVFLEARS